MRILPVTTNYFSAQKAGKKEPQTKPSFSRLFGEDRFVKDIKKSKDFSELEKNQAEMLVDMMKPGLNKPENNDITTRFLVIDANRRDPDPRGHQDRIMLRVEGHDQCCEYMIDPCIRYENPEEALDDAGLKQLASDLVDWHDNQAAGTRLPDIDLDDEDGAPPDYESSDPMNGWIDWQAM